RAELFHRESESANRCQKSSGIFKTRPNEDVEIAREARGAVEGERVRPDDQKLNGVCIQRGDEVVEVWRQVHGTASGGTPPRRCVPRAVATASDGEPVSCALLRRTTTGVR